MQIFILYQQQENYYNVTKKLVTGLVQGLTR